MPLHIRRNSADGRWFILSTIVFVRKETLSAGLSRREHFKLFETQSNIISSIMDFSWVALVGHRSGDDGLKLVLTHLDNLTFMVFNRMALVRLEVF